MKQLPALLCTTVILAVVVFALAAPAQGCRLYTPPATRVDQGCINQGNDRRIGAGVVCWLQRKLSWKSQTNPHLFLWGKSQNTHAEFAWPPYFVFNSPQADGSWRMFRVGFRYDRNWRGYIFPTAAWKCLPSALQY